MPFLVGFAAGLPFAGVDIPADIGTPLAHPQAVSNSDPRDPTEDLARKRPRVRDVQGRALSTPKTALSRSMKDAIKRFRSMESLLLSAGTIDDRLLCDFRAAVNRVRNAAWGVQQYVSRKEVGQDPAMVLKIIAGDRIRAAYSLCQTISDDLKRPDLDFQAGSLVALQEAAHKLGADVGLALQNMK
jgi:hypothetical protein